LNFDDLQSEKHFNGFATFGATKMANLVFTFDLAKRLDGSGVTVNAFHPGIVKSNIMGDAPVFIRWMSNLMGSAPDQPAADLAYLASPPEMADVTGKFFKGRAIIQPDKCALDENVQSQLWNASLGLLGMQT
jgi:retinol dehydrogenase-14